MTLQPVNECALIELAEHYEGVVTPDKQYDTKTSGYFRAPVSDEILLGKRVWFESYKDDIKVERDGKTYTFVKFEDIRGYEDDEAN